MLLDVAREPRDESYIVPGLRGSGILLSDLVSNGSLRKSGDRYVINFTLFTKEDVRRVQLSAERRARTPAGAILARRPEIEKALSDHVREGANPKLDAFVFLGCISLDRDGLELTSDKGLRAKPKKRPGGTFSFHAGKIGDIRLIFEGYKIPSSKRCRKLVGHPRIIATFWEESLSAVPLHMP
jgi:hypothetical protein